MLKVETIRSAPKALLHDHLDGGLRPQTVIELAAEVGYHELPTDDPDELARWFLRGADRKSLELYLEGFRHTVALLQTRDAIERVAAECVEDLAADNVVYAEVRYAPELSTEGGLTLAGFPPTRHLDAFQLIQRENFHVTIHAGESFGLPSIWEALQWCGAERLGHGVRIVDDITVRPDGSTELGRLAALVRDRRVPLEMCPTCNVQTGAAASIEEHPIDLLRRLRYRVTVNTDNRLMSGVTMTSEFQALAEAFGFGLDEMEWLTTNAMKSAFAPFDERLEVINEVIKPGYARLRAQQARVLAGAPASAD